MLEAKRRNELPTESRTEGCLMGQAFARADNPQMSDDFARVYEQTAHRITGPISLVALDMTGVGPCTRVLDIAAGAGALSVPAAQRGACVLAVDVAPGMVKRLSAKLEPFPGCAARVMDGEALELEDNSFDVAFSIFGVMTFSDWRRGLKEQARVLRPGGKGCIATWHRPPGGGPFLVMNAALQSVFPDRALPALPDGFIALADPARLANELRVSGFVDIEVREVEGIWEGPAGDAYLEEMRELHGYMRAYTELGARDRGKVDSAIRSLVGAGSPGGIRLRSPVLIAIGARR
jgi:ubiquinone/menaquinone biosynthesis C-methylase UbiE